MNVILCSVQGGCVSKRGNRNFSGVGVPFICNFPGELFETRVNQGEKFTFVISERAETMLMCWFTWIRNKMVLNFNAKARIIANLTFGFLVIIKHLVRSPSREQVRLTT